MALKLNQQRTYKHPISVAYFGEKGEMLTGSFTGTFKVLNGKDIEDKEKRLIDVVLLEVEGLEIVNEHDELLTGDELLNAVKNDGDLASACMEAYNESVEKKQTKLKTLSK